jgi:hypothetical protein
MKQPFCVIAIAVLIATFAGASDARNAEILQRKDNFSGKTLYFTPPEQPKLEGGSFWSQRYLLLDFEAVGPTSSIDGAYSLKIDASLPGWLFISDGPSLQLKIDGKIVEVDGAGSAQNRDVISGDQVEEVAWYTISPTILQQIASATSVDFRVIGSKGAITGSFTPAILADAKLFGSQAPSLLGITPDVSTANSALDHHGILGVQFMEVPWTMRGILHVSKGEGVWVVGVTPGSAAEIAGVEKGDVIVSFDGKDIHSNQEMQQAVKDHSSGQVAQIGIIRAGTSLQLKTSM